MCCRNTGSIDGAENCTGDHRAHSKALGWWAAAYTAALCAVAVDKCWGRGWKRQQLTPVIVFRVWIGRRAWEQQGWQLTQQQKYESGCRKGEGIWTRTQTIWIWVQKFSSCESKCLLHLNILTLRGIYTVIQLLMKQFTGTGQKQAAYSFSKEKLILFLCRMWLAPLLSLLRSSEKPDHSNIWKQ